MERESQTPERTTPLEHFVANLRLEILSPQRGVGFEIGVG